MKNKLFERRIVAEIPSPKDPSTKFIRMDRTIDIFSGCRSVEIDGKSYDFLLTHNPILATIYNAESSLVGKNIVFCGED